MNNYKTAPQIGEICGITTQTLYNWRKENKIKFEQLNSRKILYDPSQKKPRKRSKSKYNRV